MNAVEEPTTSNENDFLIFDCQVLHGPSMTCWNNSQTDCLPFYFNVKNSMLTCPFSHCYVNYDAVSDRNMLPGFKFCFY